MVGLHKAVPVLVFAPGRIRDVRTRCHAVILMIARPAGGESREALRLLPRRRGRVANHPAGAKVIRRPPPPPDDLRDKGWVVNSAEVGRPPAPQANALGASASISAAGARRHRHPLFMRPRNRSSVLGTLFTAGMVMVPGGAGAFPAGDLQDLRLAAVAADHRRENRP